MPSNKKLVKKKAAPKKINGAALYKHWIKALESGELVQAREALCKVDEQGNRSYCCLGVLCRIAKPAGFKKWYGGMLAFRGFGTQTTTELPDDLRELVGLTPTQQNGLMVLNDDLGFSFKQIARRLRVRNFTPRTLAVDEKVK